MKYELPKLNYPYDALEPHIDAQTMEIHHSKHHQAYTDKFNAVLEAHPDLGEHQLEDLFRKLNELDIDDKDRTALKNNGGGFINHNLFFETMSPKKEVDEALVEEINKTWGSVEEFKKVFTAASTTHFGSGWTWLVRDENDKLQVYALPNQDSPLTKGHTPIFNLDLWEHAYYLKYQNKRPEYIESWWNVLTLI